MDPYIYKVLRPHEWDALTSDGIFKGSVHDKVDGFIHFSTRSQLRETIEKHYQGVDKIIIVEVDAHISGPALKWEPSRGGDLFPHLYADLLLSTRTRDWVLIRNQNGSYDYPKDILSPDA